MGENCSTKLSSHLHCRVVVAGATQSQLNQVVQEILNSRIWHSVFDAPWMCPFFNNVFVLNKRVFTFSLWSVALLYQFTEWDLSKFFQMQVLDPLPPKGALSMPEASTSPGWTDENFPASLVVHESVTITSTQPLITWQEEWKRDTAGSLVTCWTDTI